MKKFSVIIPVYNEEKEISRSIRSILNQSFNDWELIVVDDGSIDETKKVVDSYLKDERIKYLIQENKGVAAARNYGARKAEGILLIFLDSDDELKPDSLKEYNSMYDSETALLSSGYLINGKPKTPNYNKKISKFKFSVAAGSFCIKKELFFSISGYDENLKQSENWEMIARALERCEQKGHKVAYTNSCNMLYHKQGNATKTVARDRHRAEATYYLHHKYTNSGVFHHRKKDFLISSAVNYTRAGEIRKARRILYKILREYPEVNNLFRIIFFEIPFLRNRKWKRRKK